MESIYRVYAAFNARDADGALALMHEDVDWPNGWQGGRIHGREAVREYWTQQWREIDSTVRPLDETVSGDRVAVTVPRLVRTSRATCSPRAAPRTCTRCGTVSSRAWT